MPFNALRKITKYFKKIDVDSLIGSFSFGLMPTDGSFHRALDIYYKLNVCKTEEPFSMKPNLSDLLDRLFIYSDVDDIKYFHIADNHFTDTVKRYLNLSGAMKKMFIKPSSNWIRKDIETLGQYSFEDFDNSFVFYDVIDQLYGIGDVFQLKEKRSSRIRVISEFFKSIVADGRCSTKGKILQQIRSRINEVKDVYSFTENSEMVRYLNDYKKDYEIKGKIFEKDIDYGLFIYYIGLWNIYPPNESIRKLQQPFMAKTLEFEFSEELESYVDYSVSVVLGAIYDLMNASIAEIVRDATNSPNVLFMTEEISFDMTKKYLTVEPDFNTATTVLHLPDRSIRLIEDGLDEKIKIVGVDMRAGIERVHPVKGNQIQLTQIHFGSQNDDDSIYNKEPSMFSITAILSNLLFPDNIADEEIEVETVSPFDEIDNTDYWYDSPLMRNHSYKELKHLVTELLFTVRSYLKFNSRNGFTAVLNEIITDLFETITNSEKLQAFHDHCTNKLIAQNTFSLIEKFITDSNPSYDDLRQIFFELSYYRWKFDLVLILSELEFVRMYYSNKMSIDVKWYVELVLRDFNDSIDNYLKYVNVLEENIRDDIRLTFKYNQKNYTDDNYFNEIFGGIDVQQNQSLRFIASRLNDIIVNFSTLYMDINAMRMIENAPQGTYFMFYGGSYHGDLYGDMVRVKENSC